MKRKESWDVNATQQFKKLRRLPELTQEVCRKIISEMIEDDVGTSVCQRQKEKFPLASPLLNEVMVPSGNVTWKAFHNDFVGLVQQKAITCALFAALLEQAFARTNGALTLIFFCDEATTGNVLATRQERKCLLVYLSFLEMDCLFLENMWLPFSCLRVTHDGESLPHTEYVRLLLEYIFVSVDAGFVVDCSEKPHLFWLQDCIVLGDHEGLRALSGSKGSAGAKPCLHCSNVVSNRRNIPTGHVSICESNASRFVRQTDATLSQVADFLVGCQSKKDLQSAEVALGWNREGLLASCLTSNLLKNKISLKSLVYDSICISIGPMALSAKSWDAGSKRIYLPDIPWICCVTGLSWAGAAHLASR